MIKFTILRSIVMAICLSSSHAVASCSSTSLFLELEKIADVGMMHNCAIEVSIHEGKNERSLNLWMQNLNHCEDIEKCSDINLGIKLDRNCFDQSHRPGRLHSVQSYKVTSDNKITSFISMKQDRFGNILKLDAGEFSSESGFKNRVLCSLK